MIRIQSHKLKRFTVKTINIKILTQTQELK